MTTTLTKPPQTTAAPVSDPDLIAVAQALYRDSEDYKLGGARRWRELVAAWPELADAALPKPDTGTGSDDSRLSPGESWHVHDKTRQLRIRRPKRRPTCDMTLRDGSPLRVPDLGEIDVDGDPLDGSPLWHSEGEELRDPDDEARANALAERDRLEVPGDDESAVDLLGTGDRSELSIFNLSGADKAHQHLLQFCVLCGKPLDLEYPETQCEFPDSPMPDGTPCRCNGCRPTPKRTQGRPRYCSHGCHRRMDNAMDRARRRSEGKKSRPSAADPEADRIAQFRIDMRDRARSGKHR